MYGIDEINTLREETDSDVDTSRHTVTLFCPKCGKREQANVIGEDLGTNLAQNEDGSYTPITGECAACLTGDTSVTGF